MGFTVCRNEFTRCQQDSLTSVLADECTQRSASSKGVAIFLSWQLHEIGSYFYNTIHLHRNLGIIKATHACNSLSMHRPVLFSGPYHAIQLFAAVVAAFARAAENAAVLFAFCAIPVVPFPLLALPPLPVVPGIPTSLKGYLTSSSFRIQCFLLFLVT